MKQYWENYVAIFRTLIRSGWQIFRRKGSVLRMWVYPCTSLPTKYKMKEAFEILTYANKFNTISGTTYTHNIHFNLFYSTKMLWK